VQSIQKHSVADEITPDVVAVRFGRADNRKLEQLARQLGGTVRTPLDSGGAGTIQLPKGSDVRSAAATLSRASGVVAAGPLVKRFKLLAPPQRIPNDPDFGTLPYTVPNPSVTNPPIQWDMYKMRMPEAWFLPTGFGSASVKIAIIDTGYDKAHTDLAPAGRVASSVVYDLGTGLADTAASAQDCDGHGTDVTGIAAGDTDNLIDTAGAAGLVTLYEVRVFPNPTTSNPSPGASTIDVASAINWAVANNVNVISMSLGSSSPDPVYEEPAVANAIAHGVTVVAAAGNSGAASLDYPANDPSVIAVGASALNDAAHPRDYQQATEKVASYSQYILSPPASKHYVVAPGGDPDSTQQGCTTNACLDFLQWVINLYSNTAHQFHGPLILIAGTSQATPHVAGLAALILQKHPGLTSDQVGTYIQNSTVNIGDPKQGHGRVDAYAALNLVP
jgi:subtilisin